MNTINRISQFVIGFLMLATFALIGAPSVDTSIKFVEPFASQFCEEPKQEELPVGSLCLHVSDHEVEPLTSCTFNFLQLRKDPQPLHMSIDGCDGHYFSGVQARRYDILTTCGEAVVQTSADVPEDDKGVSFVTLPEPIADGSLCMAKLGLPIDLDSPVVSIQPWLGFGKDSDCKTEGHKMAVYKVMKVSDISGPNCKGLTDPNCPVRPIGKASDSLMEGEFQHLLWTADFSKLPKGKGRAVYKLTVEVGGVQKVDVYLDVLKDKLFIDA